MALITGVMEAVVLTVPQSLLFFSFLLLCHDRGGSHGGAHACYYGRGSARGGKATHIDSTMPLTIGVVSDFLASSKLAHGRDRKSSVIHLSTMAMGTKRGLDPNFFSSFNPFLHLVMLIHYY